MSKVAVLLADGFEPVEALAPVDCMRRAGIEANTVAVTANRRVTAAQSIQVEADYSLEDIDFDHYDAILVPGGSVGVENLKACDGLQEPLENFMHHKHVFTICAGPTVLGKLNLLDGYRYTCYPECEATLPADGYEGGPGVVVDKNLVTASGPGQALVFGIACVRALRGKDVAEKVAQDMLIKCRFSE